DLQMMAGNTFVVDGGGLQPGVELLRPGRDVPPHAAGPGEVLTGTGVVDPAGAGGGDAALQAAQRRRDVDVDISERVARGDGELLHAGLQGLGRVQRPGRVRPQRVLRGGDGAAAAGSVVIVVLQGVALLLR